MNKFIRKQLFLFFVLCTVGFTANAQFYEIGNQITRLFSPALSGSFNYKGFIEASYLKGIGDDRFDVVDISTTQGFKYKSWCFMGVGAGVDFMLPSLDNKQQNDDPEIMVPVYTDFRFFIGNQSNVGMTIDLRVGAAFTFADRFNTNHGRLYEDECFYLRPSIGLRIPFSNAKRALNIGISYQLLVSDFYDDHYGWDQHKAFNNVGATIGFEW